MSARRTHTHTHADEHDDRLIFVPLKISTECFVSISRKDEANEATKKKNEKQTKPTTIAAKAQNAYTIHITDIDTQPASVERDSTDLLDFAT